MAIGLAPVFVKQLVALGGVSPVAAGFWRMAVGSLGFFTMIALTVPRQKFPEVFRLERSHVVAMFVAGAMFALDLAAWHTSFNYTSVASSTLIANLSSVFVPLCGVLFFRERPGRALYIGGAIALMGVIGLTVFKLPVSGTIHQQSLIMGEGLAFLTAFFYTGYMLSIKRLTNLMPSLKVMAFSSSISSIILLAIVCLQHGALIPRSFEGWMYLLGLGLVSQVLGQGLIARALSVLPVSTSALLLSFAPASSAVFGWLFLGEVMSAGQVASVVVTLTGIAIVALR